jgi:chaperonin GroES
MENLALNIPKEELQKIGRKVVGEYKADLRSRSEWEKRAESWLNLFSGHRNPISFPWKDASNINIPLLSIAALQFNARALDSLLPGKEIAKCYPTDGKAIERAARTSRHFNWQLTEDIDDFEDGMDELLLMLPVYGCGFKKTYYDEVAKKPASQILSFYEFVVPYKTKRLSKCPRMTHAYEEYINDIKIKAQSGVYIEDAAKLPAGSGNDTNQPSPIIQRKVDDNTGIEQNLSVEQPRLILEQHRWLDLNGDNIEEPYIVIVDSETSKVLSIQSRSYTDQNGKTRIIEYFTDYHFIKNPDSIYAYGFGHFMEHLNESANTIINQLVNAGTLSTTISGIINKRSGIKKGHLSFRMGEFAEADVTTDDIRKAIHEWNFKEPSGVLFNLLGLVVNYAKEISSVSDSMLGKLPPSDTTATSMLTVLEQGLKIYSTIHKRVHRSFKKELRKIFFINSQTLDEEIYFQVQDETSSDMVGYTSGRDDYANMIDVIPVSDPTITSKAEKLVKAQTVFQAVMNDQEATPENRYEAKKKYLEANEIMNVDQYITKPQPSEPPDLSPVEENALFLQEKDSIVLPQQDHVKHRESHQIFYESMWGEQLTAQGKKLVEHHNMVHMSYQYTQEQAAIKQRNMDQIAMNSFEQERMGMEQMMMQEGQVPNE